MHQTLSHESLKQLFTEARTHHAWTPQPVAEATLRSIFDLTKWGPTSMNTLPMRILFIQTQAAKEKLYPALMGNNKDQIKEAPITAIIAYDEKFYMHLPKLFPAFDAIPMFKGNPALITSTAFRNSTLQGAYFMLATRSLGLDVGPMSGFDNALVDQSFFQNTSWKSNFLCNIGYADKDKVYPRGERLSFDEICKIL